MLFTDKSVNLKKAVFMDDLYRACCRVPHVQVLASQKRLDIIVGYRAGKLVYETLPACGFGME